MAIKIIFIVLFFAVTVLVGVLSRKRAGSIDGFVLGGRAVGPWLSAFSFGTSYFSAVIFIGYAGRFGWNFGLASTWIGLGNAFIGSLMAWVILGRRTRVMTQHIGSKTMPDFFGLRFNSKALKIVAALIVFIFLIPYTASLFNGLSQLFSASFAGIDYAWWVVIMAVLTGAYVILGGYMGSAINNFIQGIIMLVGIVAVVGAVINSHGGLTEAIAKLSADSFTTPAGTEFEGAYTSFLGPQPLQLLGVVVLTSLGTWGLPQMISKFYSIKDEKAITKGTVISTVFALVVAGGCYFLGGFGRLYAADITMGANGAPASFDAIIPTMLTAVNKALGVGGDMLVGLVLILVLSASMSTLSSLVMTSSSTITLDLISSVSKKTLSEKKKMVIMRLLIALSIAVSAFIAILLVVNTELAGKLYISDLMGISWGALAGCFLAPFMYGLFWKKVTPAAVWASFATGLGIMITEFVLTSVLKITFENAFMKYFFNSAINAGMLAMLAGLVIVPVVSLLTRRTAPKNVDEMFACYDKEVTVSVKTSLED
ncbi:MAG: sodium:solute symporter [Ruminococcaceae bacterium]|nr:sodium:solute symporter [Oscillospiraceae bacterium]